MAGDVMRPGMAAAKIMGADEAAALIKDGDTIWVNAFLSIANPVDLNAALTRRVRAGKGPKGLKVYCSAGFGDWKAGSPCEGYIAEGAAERVVLGHFASMPATCEKALANEIEAYNLPLGVMSHMVRDAAAGMRRHATTVGLNLFVDPRQGACGLNARSQAKLVQAVVENGEERLLYEVPDIDVALIKGSSADMRGNISFEDECATLDALSTAQAARNNGGKVIVQVSRVTDKHQRPRNVIIPGMLVDAIVVCENQTQLMNVSGNNMSLSGDVRAEGRDVEIWLRLLQSNIGEMQKKRDAIHSVIANRAFRELRAGQVVNIGIGISELVGLTAVRCGMLSDVYLTVESGASGGLPVNGAAFGAAIGADIIVDMAQQFDFYDGGGLDICFVGTLEIDGEGNANSHVGAARLVGIGGFANITQNSRNVVFCCTFSAKGLEAEISGCSCPCECACDGSGPGGGGNGGSGGSGGNGGDCGSLRILSEGEIPKFVPKVRSPGFSSKNALARGQNVLYVTERCVFRLVTADGGGGCLELVEVADGVDVQRDILDRLPFAVKVAQPLRRMRVDPETI